jgi:hypothetical protein
LHLNFTKTIKLLLEAWPALLVGIAAFFAITGGKILDPTHTTWLMNGDPTQHWLGWEFFRHTPPLQWPLGANPNYGMELGSSIVFSDSIPLLAFPFKLLNALLPAQFQYFGLWLLCCFVLQAMFSYKLLGLFTDSTWLRVVGCSFFVIAPPMVWRLHQHYALVGHWVLVAALYLYFSKDFKAWRWPVLLVATVLVHAFLFFMVGVLWTADMAQRKLNGQLSWPKFAQQTVVSIGSVVLVMWVVGYFMLGGAPQAGYGFGIYRFNLLSLIDSGEVWASEQWSKVLRNQPQTEGDYEGFAFLGLGILCLGILASVELARLKLADMAWATVIPVACAAALLFVFALSPKVVYGTQELWTYSWGPLERLGWVFRSTGRMIWPVFYLLYAVIFFLLFRHANRNFLLVACTVLLAAQLSDSAPAFKGFRTRMLKAHWQSPLTAPQWAQFGKQYQHIVYVLPQFTPPRWIDLTHFAAMNQMSVSAGYFARVDMNLIEQQRQVVGAVVRAGQFKPDTLYVFDDDALWSLVQQQPREKDFIAELNGVRVLAPEFLVK